MKNFNSKKWADRPKNWFGTTFHFRMQTNANVFRIDSEGKIKSYLNM